MYLDVNAAPRRAVNIRPGNADEADVSERIVILSDLHLGRPRHSAGSAEKLRPLWQGATQLILNGDTAEVHHKDQWSQAARQVLRLFDMCEEDGAHLTLISGNHDPFLSDVRALGLAGGQVFVTHGDAFHPAVAPWSPRAAHMRRAFAKALALLDPESRGSLEDHLEASQHAGHAEWQVLADVEQRPSLWSLIVHPFAFAASMRWWRLYPGLAAAFATRHAPHARYVVSGHTHFSSIRNIGGRTIINTGGFGMHRKPLAVVIENDEVRVHKIGRSGDLFVLAPRPHSVFALEPQPPGVVQLPPLPLPVEVTAA
jgi:UDP-2,3-diacylglucosamine pyrophosphatase LpxH